MLTMTHDVERLVTTYGELVKRARDARGITSTGLSIAIGRNPSYISRLEVGIAKETPPPDVMLGLERELGLSVAEQLEALGYPVREERERVRPRVDFDPCVLLEPDLYAINWSPERIKALRAVLHSFLVFDRNTARVNSN